MCVIGRYLYSLLVICVLGLVATSAHTQTYPDKPIKIVVPFPAGGPTDAYARAIAQRLQQVWDQPVLVENRAGGTGLIGTRAVQASVADGHTLLFTSNSAHVVGALARNPMPYDPIKDFTPISMLIRYPMYLVIHPQVPAATIQEFIALAKKNPGQYTYSSVGLGSGTHLACALFGVAAGIDIVHVPYKGASPAQTAVVSGEVKLMCDSVGFSQRLVDAGKLRGVALTGQQRSKAVPDIPTLAESGLQGVDTYTWLGMFGPAGMPVSIVSKLNHELVRIMASPDLRERVSKEGSDVIADQPLEFVAKIQDESNIWLKIIRGQGITLE